MFTELPRLLERAGPGSGQETSTGIFTVLAEGDDHNEPVADAMRAMLDGHTSSWERQIAERGRYPAIDILGSVSMPRAADPADLPVLTRARQGDGDLCGYGGAHPALGLPRGVPASGKGGIKASWSGISTS